MRAEIKSIEANDLPTWPNWEAQHPADEDQWFTLTIGPTDAEGGDLFEVEVASPTGLHERRGKRPFMGVVVSVFTPEQIQQSLRAIVETLEADSWQSLAAQLQPTMVWEFDNYQP